MDHAPQKHEFDLLLKRGVIRLSLSQRANALHMVPKPGCKWDATNDKFIAGRYSLDIIEDLLEGVCDPVFLVIDVQRAFYPAFFRLTTFLAEEFRPNTAADFEPPSQEAGLHRQLPKGHLGFLRRP